MLSTATPQQEPEQNEGQDMALQQSEGGQEVSFALGTAILLSCQWQEIAASKKQEQMLPVTSQP